MKPGSKSLGTKRLGTKELDSILFHAFLESMSDTFTVWSDDQKLVSFNKKYENMYFSKVRGLKVGITLKEACKLSVKNGNSEGISALSMYKKYSAILKKASKLNDNQTYERAVGNKILQSTFIKVPNVGQIITQKNITAKIQLKQNEIQKDKQIADQHNWFNAALDSMSQGLCAFDENKLLIMCNEAYTQIFELPKKLTKQGTKFEDILHHRISKGLIPKGESAKTYLRNRLAMAKSKKPDQDFVEKIKRRHIRVFKNPIKGGGWIGVVHDISEEIKQQEIEQKKDKHIASQNSLINAAISNMSHGLSMFGPDHKLIISNDIYAKFYSLPKKMIKVGTPIKDILKYRLAHNMSSDDESDEEFLEKRLDFVDGAPTADNFIEKVDKRLLQVIRKPMAGGGWVATHQDISEQNQKEKLIELRSSELEQQNNRFDTAINNMSHGLALFDKDNKLVICNQPYIEIYELPKKLSQVGTSFWDILDHDATFGRVSIADKKQRFEIIGEVLKTDKPISGPINMLNGQIIFMNHHPLDDGGWITIHEDITEKVEKEKLIKIRTDEILQQNMRFDAAVNNMSHGLAMFDKDCKLVICNRPFAKLYKLPKKLSKPNVSLWDILDHGAKYDMVSIADKKQRLKTLSKVIKSNKPSTGPITMLNGQIIFINHQPLEDGGWLSTHEDITEQHKSEELIRHMAKHDGLTGLLNRRAFHEILLEKEDNIKSGEGWAVLCVDLDHFKPINDSFGHAIGDETLKVISQRIANCIKDYGFIARLGGDEFTALIKPLCKKFNVEKIAQNILIELAKPVCLDEIEVIIGGSIGIAIAPKDGKNSKTLMHNADLALYHIKNQGRGDYCFFKKAMSDKQKARITIEAGLKNALKNQELQLHFQPLISLKDNQISCCEALMRWETSKGKTYSPFEFIPVAEETGLIREMGNWALQTACKSAAKWSNDVRVAVNVSPIQFSNDDLINQVSKALKDSGLDPCRLELEITESVSLAESDRNLEILHKLKSMGVRIALDDFGTGFSSLSYLRSFPFDKVKIDRSFISSLDEKPESIAIIKAVVDIGKSLNMSVTAEGIETEEQLRAVFKQDCDEVQGYLFSPPLPQNSIEKLLQQKIKIQKTKINEHKTKTA